MRILDFFFGKEKTIPIRKSEGAKIEIRNEYEQIKKETETFKSENRNWQKEFNDVISSREAALNLEKVGKIFEALELYLKSIEKAENSNKLTINNYAFDIDRVIVLFGKTKQKEKLKEFLEDKINRHQDYNNLNEWIVRLSKLNSDNTIKSIPLQKSEIAPQIVSNPSLGKQIDDFKKKMPEFNFYFNMPEGSDALGYSNKVPFELSKKLAEYRKAFEIIKSRAKIAENEGDYKTAIEAYEKMIIEKCEDVEPYERLIIIYSKLKWKQEEISILERAIMFFTKLKEQQLEYINYLAKKYNRINKAQEYISQDKKIFYYLGVFELYNPQVSRLNKWNERLNKLKQK